MQNVWQNLNHRKISNTRRIKSQNLNDFSSRLTIVFVQSIEASWYGENEDVVGAAPTGDAPTTYEWSTIWLSTKMLLILDVLLYTKW